MRDLTLASMGTKIHQMKTSKTFRVPGLSLGNRTPKICERVSFRCTGRTFESRSFPIQHTLKYLPCSNNGCPILDSGLKFSETQARNSTFR
jgi:hypothetical protein